MPKIDIKPNKLKKLINETGKEDEELRNDLFNLGLEFEGLTDDGEFELEFAPDRLDRLSIEGVARSLEYQYGKRQGLEIPETKVSDWKIKVEETVPTKRPNITGAIIRDIDLTEEKLDSLIQLQEKLHATMGRRRNKGAIGIHDLDKIETQDKTLIYKGIGLEEEQFTPLESKEQMTPSEVLERHEKGQKYSNVVEGYEKIPAIVDDGEMFSLPPIINGKKTEVTTSTENLLLELTGTDQWTIDKMCNIIAYALDYRDASIEKIKVEAEGEKVEKPEFEVKTKEISHDNIEKTIGTDFTEQEILNLLEKSGLKSKNQSSPYKVKIPPYRVDILHPIDIVDDIGRAYGFNNLEPEYPEIGTIGGRSDSTRLEDKARDTLTNLGFEDMLNFHMISKRENFKKMNIRQSGNHIGAKEPVEITKPYSKDYEILRTWAAPSLLMVLQNNKHNKYPQKLAEIGLKAHRDQEKENNVNEQKTVAAVIAEEDASYEQIKSKLENMVQRFGKNLQTPPIKHPSFQDNKTAEIKINGKSAGIIGKIDEQVKDNYNMETEITAFEFNLKYLD